MQNMLIFIKWDVDLGQRVNLELVLYCTMSQCWLLLYILCLSADWYYGEKHGVMGLLPANYIKLLVDMEEGDDKVS